MADADDERALAVVRWKSAHMLDGACLKVRVETVGVTLWHACRHRHRRRMPLRLRHMKHLIKNTSSQTLTPPHLPPVTAANTDWMARDSLAQIESDRISIIQAFPYNSAVLEHHDRERQPFAYPRSARLTRPLVMYATKLTLLSLPYCSVWPRTRKNRRRHR